MTTVYHAPMIDPYFRCKECGRLSGSAGKCSHCEADHPVDQKEYDRICKSMGVDSN